MLLTVTCLSLLHARRSGGYPQRFWGYPHPPEANVKDVYGFPWPPPGLLGIYLFIIYGATLSPSTTKTHALSYAYDGLKNSVP